MTVWDPASSTRCPELDPHVAMAVTRLAFSYMAVGLHQCPLTRAAHSLKIPSPFLPLFLGLHACLRSPVSHTCVRTCTHTHSKTRRPCSLPHHSANPSSTETLRQALPHPHTSWAGAPPHRDRSQNISTLFFPHLWVSLCGSSTTQLPVSKHQASSDWVDHRLNAKTMVRSTRTSPPRAGVPKPQHGARGWAG